MVVPRASDQKINTICCGWTNRGVALGDGHVYLGQLHGKLVALDQKTVKVAWTTQLARLQEGFTITNAPLYYNGRSTRHSQAASSGSAVASRRSTPRRAKRTGASTRFPAPARSATTPGRRPATPGSTAVHRSGRPPPSTRSSGCSISPPATRRLISTAQRAPATTSSPRRSLRSTRRRARTAGTSSSPPRHLGLRRHQPGRPLHCLGRRSPAPCNRPGQQDRFRLHPRPRDRQAPDRDRRASGASAPSMKTSRRSPIPAVTPSSRSQFSPAPSAPSQKRCPREPDSRTKAASSPRSLPAAPPSRRPARSEAPTGFR